jgi:formylmethanofuran dehydrogenase subunit C
MTATLTLTLTAGAGAGVDLAGIHPAALAGKSLTAIRRLRVPVGGASVALGELFTITGTVGETLHFRGLSSACHRVGHGMTGGSIEVTGSVGTELGREMTGGRIKISGNAGDGVGSGMRGGVIVIAGDAGDAAGGAVAGATHGMNGGLILIGRNAGARCGERLRRGFILVAGDAGAHAGERMIAGTLAVFGRCGPNPGFGMRRGSLMLAAPPAAMAPTFNDCGDYVPGFLPLLQRYLGEHHRAHARRFDVFARTRRFCGDLAFGGKGELLVAAAPDARRRRAG